MIMKCRDMDRVMAESSQKLLHGGIRSRDWFSDKLGNLGEKQVQLGCLGEMLKPDCTSLSETKFPTVALLAESKLKHRPTQLSAKMKFLFFALTC